MDAATTKQLEPRTWQNFKYEDSPHLSGPDQTSESVCPGDRDQNEPTEPSTVIYT